MPISKVSTYAHVTVYHKAGMIYVTGAAFCVVIHERAVHYPADYIMKPNDVRHIQQSHGLTQEKRLA